MNGRRTTAKAAREDHVDRRLEELRLEGVPDIDLVVEGIVERIQVLERRFRQAQESTLADHGLSLGEWKALTHLRHAPPLGLTPGELSRKLMLSSGAMTNRLDRLEKAGLVRRRPDPADRRGVRVDITEVGNRVWAESANAQAIKESLVASALSEREQHELNTLLRKLMLEFERNAG
jgi:DNA-binding MarR family transcriptional regulator